MSDQPSQPKTEKALPPSAEQGSEVEAGTAGQTGMEASTRRSTRTRVRQLPPYRVLLHDDNEVEMALVVRSIVELTPLSAPSAREVMLTAHEQGVAQVLITHRERAELYQEQLISKGLTVTIEPAAD